MRWLAALIARLDDSLAGDAIGIACLFATGWLLLIAGMVLQ